MKFHMHNLLKSRKAQFYILSAVAIIGILYFLSRWLEPTSIVDTSSIAISDEPFVFNNIKEKTTDIVKLSKDCEELRDNLAEYKQFVENYALEKGYKLDFYYSYPSCNPSGIAVDFEISMTSTRMTISSLTFSVPWPQ
jgi:hypothetical protein